MARKQYKVHYRRNEEEHIPWYCYVGMWAMFIIVLCSDGIVNFICHVLWGM